MAVCSFHRQDGASAGGTLSGSTLAYMCVPEILQMRVTAQNVNNAGLHEPYCELFFFLLKHESANGESPVSSQLICVIIGGPWKRVVPEL